MFLLIAEIRNNDSVQPSSNKEKINSKNVEIPKLGIKPLQMKTRKKYNLRKSLAWDTAFFTDEGSPLITFLHFPFFSFSSLSSFHRHSGSS